MSPLAAMKCYQWSWEVVVRANVVQTNKVDGDLHCTYPKFLFRDASWFWVVVKR